MPDRSRSHDRLVPMVVKQKRDSGTRGTFEPVVVRLRVYQQTQPVLFPTGRPAFVENPLHDTRVRARDHVGMEVDLRADCVANSTVRPGFRSECVFVHAVECCVHDCVTLVVVTFMFGKWASCLNTGLS